MDDNFGINSWMITQEKWEDSRLYRKFKWKYMVPQSLEISEIVAKLPVPMIPQFIPTVSLKLLTMIITDRVGTNLSHKDRVLANYTHIVDYFQAAQYILKGKIQVNTRSVIVFMGLDWCLSATRSQVREGVRKLVFAIRSRNPLAFIGFSDITHRYLDLCTNQG